MVAHLVLVQTVLVRLKVGLPFYGSVAQWLEQLTHNLLVAGSIPAGSTIAG